MPTSPIHHQTIGKIHPFIHVIIGFENVLDTVQCSVQQNGSLNVVHQQLSEFSDELRKTEKNWKKLEKTAGLKSVFFRSAVSQSISLMAAMQTTSFPDT